MFQLLIKTSSAAFDDDPGKEVARILRAIAKVAEDSFSYAARDSGSAVDENGNCVGVWRWEREMEP